VHKKKIAWMCYVVVLHLAVLAAAFNSSMLRRAAYDIGIAPEPEDSRVKWMRQVHQRMDAVVPDGAVIFLGDSITQSLATAAVTPLSVNYAIGGQRSDELLESMRQYSAISRSSAVVIMIGTNDILEDKAVDFEARYREILTSVPAGIPVYFNSIPPIAWNEKSGSAVDEANRASRAACANDNRCIYVDVWAGLTAAGTPLDGMLQPDGVHLRPAAYARWIDLLLPHFAAVGGARKVATSFKTA
jgi:lysophospholipase L1-like esterase